MAGGWADSQDYFSEIEKISYIIHKRTKDGSLDSLFTQSTRDLIAFENMKMESLRPKRKGTGDSTLDAFSDFLEKE